MESRAPVVGVHPCIVTTKSRPFIVLSRNGACIGCCRCVTIRDTGFDMSEAYCLVDTVNVPAHVMCALCGALTPHNVCSTSWKEAIARRILMDDGEQR